MLAAGREHAERVWAIEGCDGIGKHIASSTRICPFDSNHAVFNQRPTSPDQAAARGSVVGPSSTSLETER